MPVHKQRTFDMSDTEVGAALNAARTRAQLNVRDAADSAGIDWRVLSRIERGERPCRVTEFVAVCEAVGAAPLTVMQAAMGWESAWSKLRKSRR